MLDGFPKQLPGDGEASPRARRPRRRQPQRADRRQLRRRRPRLRAATAASSPGWPVRHRPAAAPDRAPRVHAAARSTAADGAVLATPGGRRPRPRRRRSRSSSPTSRASVYVFDRRRRARPPGWTTEPALRRHPADAVRQRRARASCNRTQHGFLGSPVLADLDGDDDGRLEIVAAAMDRHVYAWNDDGTRRRRAGRCSSSTARRSSAIDPRHAPGHLQGRTSAPTSTQGAIIDTPAVGDLDGDGAPGGRRRHERVVRDGDDGGSTPAASTRRVLRAARRGARARPTGACSRSSPTASPATACSTAPSPYLAGWPFKVGILQARACCRSSARASPARPVIGAVPLQRRRPRRRASARSPRRASRYLVNADGQSCYGRDRRHATARCRPSGGAATDQPFLAAFGHPGVRRRSAGADRRSSRPRPACMRALDVVAARVPGRRGLPRRLGHRDRAGRARAGPRRSTTCSSSPGRRSPTSTALPGRGDRRRHGEHRPPGLHRARAPTSPRLAEADRRLDGRQPGDRDVRGARHRRGRDEGRRRG